MVKVDLAEYLAEIGRKGGKARLKSMSPDERKEVAALAGKASGEARRKKAKAKKKAEKAEKTPPKQPS